MEPPDLQNLWNALVGDRLPAWIEMNPGRIHLAKARLAECSDETRWAAAISRICKSSFLTGLTGDRGWRATPEWLLKPGCLVAIEEGKYDNPKDRAPEAGRTNWQDLSYFNAPRPWTDKLTADEVAEAEQRGRDIAELERRTHKKYPSK